MPELRLVFFGTAELACASLSALVRAPGLQVAGVVTQPDRPRGRDLQLQPPPVKVRALELGLPVWQPERCRHPDFVQRLRDVAPDLIVVAAYGQILPPALLDLPRHGCINVHASLLPQYRGAAPIQWAILDDQPETGVTLMRMDAGLDTGDRLAWEHTPILETDNAQTLHDRLAQLGAQLLVRSLPAYVNGTLLPQPQPAEGASYARKITKEDGALDWTLPARSLWNRVRGLIPWPGTYTHVLGGPAPLRLKVWAASVAQSSGGQAGVVLEAGPEGVVVACGQGSLRLLELQREGGRRLDAARFLSGCPLPPGQRLGQA